MDLIEYMLAVEKKVREILRKGKKNNVDPSERPQ